MQRQVEIHATEKRQYDPTHPGIVHQVAVELNEDAGNVADVAVDADADGDEDAGEHADADVDEDVVLQEQPVLRQMLQSVLQYYRFEQTVENRLRELGKVVCAVRLGGLSKSRYVVQQSTSTVAHGDPLEG